MKKIITFIVAILCLLGLSSCTKQDQLKIIDIKLTDEDYSYAIKKNNIQLKNEMDAYIAEIKANGEFDEIIRKYITGSEENKIGVFPTTQDVVNDDDTFVVATNMPFGPFEYKGSDGKAYGIDIEIAIGFAESRGLELAVVEMDFNSIFFNISSGFSDIGMAGITITPARAEEYEFTTPYYNASQKLIVKKNNHDFDQCKTVDDVEDVLKKLENKEIGYQNGTTGNWYIVGDEGFGFDGFDNIKGVGYSTLLSAFQDVSYGSVYAAVADELPAEALLDKLNDSFIEKVQNFMTSLGVKYFRMLLLEGFINTIAIAIIGLFVGIVIGIIVGMIKVAPKYKWYMKVLDKIATCYVTIFRGTPIVVQLLVAYFVIRPILPIMINKLPIAIIVFGLNSGAYISEIIRGGINSVDKGQMEASRALGQNYKTSMFKVVIPQAIKNIIPSIGNEFIALIKETSIVSFISIIDLYSALQKIGDPNYDYMVPYIAMALVYVIVIVIISGIIKLIEKRFAKSDRK